MKRSESRILTTHTGSLPRSPALRDLLVRLDRGEAVDAAALAREAEAAVRHVVARQLEAGIDVGNDGEQPRVGFSTYPARRMRGFGGASTRRMARDIAEHPDYAARLSRQRAGAARINDAPQAVAEVAYTDLGEATAECELFRRAPGADKFAEAFMTAASPGVIATIMLDAYYGSHERYVKALAREMRKEYELIVTRGFVLQLDCPDLAMERARFFQDEPLDGFLRAVALHIDAINEAIAGLPADRVRLHLCWGNYDGPHTHDVPLEPLPPETWWRWKDAFGQEILDGIGSTEMLHVYCSNRAGAVRPGSTGKPVPGYDLRRVDDQGNVVSDDRPGILEVRGDSSAPAYWRQHARSQQTMRGEWVVTGDLYRVDEDGFYWYEGRADDMIKVGGEWVSPIEMENALLAHPSVQEVAVVGISFDGTTRIRAVI